MPFVRTHYILQSLIRASGERLKKKKKKKSPDVSMAVDKQPHSRKLRNNAQEPLTFHICPAVGKGLHCTYAGM